MSVLRLTVQCCRCKREVDKLEARSFKSNKENDKEDKFECFDCFKKTKPELWCSKGIVSNKETFYCEQCRYKFTSKENICPMCGKREHVVPGAITIRDLL